MSLVLRVTDNPCIMKENVGFSLSEERVMTVSVNLDLALARLKHCTAEKPHLVKHIIPGLFPAVIPTSCNHSGR
jgi:hypothetical protein